VKLEGATIEGKNEGIRVHNESAMSVKRNRQARSHVITLDIGATWLRVARFREREKARVAKIFTPNGDASLRVLREIVQSLELDETQPDTVGISRAPGLDKVGVVNSWPNRPDWIGIPLVPSLRQLFPNAEIVDFDDGEAACAWEHFDLSRKDGESSITLSIGTGLAAGMVRCGMVLATGDGANTLGHLPLGKIGSLCSCGRSGCLQATFCPKDGIQADGEILVGALRNIVRHLAREISPDFLVITGGRTRPTQHVLASYVHTKWAELPSIQFSRRPAISGVAGAALLAIDGRKIGASGYWIRDAITSAGIEE
jgi:hypothetical protein